MNRYSPHYNHDENCMEMTVDDEGSWVHITKASDLLRERDEARAEIERLNKLLNPKPKPDLRDTLLRQMKAAQRREIYRQAWEAAILEGKERNEAHRIAAEAADAVVSLEEI